jgi:hypothetical protein
MKSTGTVRKQSTPNQPMQRTRSGGLRPPARAADGRRLGVIQASHRRFRRVSFDYPLGNEADGSQ